ncbi:hypothetical protein MKX03_021351, partial [Papaver bracteatum]
MGTSVTVLILVRVLPRSKSSLATILDARNLHLSVYSPSLESAVGMRNSASLATE